MSEQQKKLIAKQKKKTATIVRWVPRSTRFLYVFVAFWLFGFVCCHVAVGSQVALRHILYIMQRECVFRFLYFVFFVFLKQII